MSLGQSVEGLGTLLQLLNKDTMLQSEIHVNYILPALGLLSGRVQVCCHIILSVRRKWHCDLFDQGEVY